MQTLYFSCGKCDSSCSECNGPASTECMACSKDKYLFRGRCVNKILNGFYATYTGNTYMLKRCHYTCEECTGPNSQECIKCIGEKIIHYDMKISSAKDMNF